MFYLFPSPALPKEYQRIGKAFQNLSSVFTSSGYQGTTMETTGTSHAAFSAPGVFSQAQALASCVFSLLQTHSCNHVYSSHDCSSKSITDVMSPVLSCGNGSQVLVTHGDDMF